MSRAARQTAMVVWGIQAFGKEQMASVEHRALRLVEEVIEAAQAARCDRTMLHHLIDYVYSRPVGELPQELGGVGICTLLLANAADLDADKMEAAEVARVLALPLSHFTKRNKEKDDAGFKA